MVNKKTSKSKKDGGAGALDKLKETLYDAEKRQLESFVHARSQTLDQQIAELKASVLGSSNEEVRGISQSGGGAISGIQGKSLTRAPIRNIDDTLRSSLGLDSSDMKFDRNTRKNDTQRARLTEELDKAHKSLLIRMKASAEDRELTRAEVYQLLLPPSTCGPDVDSLPLDEVVDTIQLDLCMGLTVDDQRIMVKNYSNESGEIHIPSLLSACGLMPGIEEIDALNNPLSPTTSGFDKVTHPAKDNMHPQVDFGQDNLVTLGNTSRSLDFDNNYSKSVIGKEIHDPTKARMALTSSLHGDMIARSRNNVDSLADMHGQIARTMEGTGLPEATLSDNNALAALQQRRQDHDALNQISENLTSDYTAAPEAPAPPTKSVSEMTAAEIDAIGTETTGAAATFLVNGKVDNMINDLREGTLATDRELGTDTTTIDPPTQTESPEASRAKTVADFFGDLHLQNEHKARSPGRSNTSAPTATSLEGSQSDRDRLVLENLRLKKELGKFDVEFFEQLEDLKFRYSRLQEIVGEVPPGATGATSVLDETDFAPGMSKYVPVHSKSQRAPIDKLAWNARNSVTALDRAGITSPLVGHRRQYSSSNTFAPGGLDKYGIASGKAATKGYYSGLDDRNGGTGASTSRPAVTSSMTNATLGSLGALGGGINAEQYAPWRGTSLRHEDGTPTHLGGSTGVGSGLHSASGSADTYSDLCERRLVFELSNHPKPEHAARSLIHRCTESAATNGKNGSGNGRYLSVAQLSAAMQSVGLRLGQREIEALASGFGSDGKGGIDVKEFSTAVQTMVYNLIGPHAARAAAAESALNGSGTNKKLSGEEAEVHRMMKELAESILAHDRQAYGSTGIGNDRSRGGVDEAAVADYERRKRDQALLETLLVPFAEEDTDRSGSLELKLFASAIRNIGGMFTLQETSILAKHYRASEETIMGRDGKPLPPTMSSWDRSETDQVKALRDREMLGSMRATASREDGAFNGFLTAQGIGLEENYKVNYSKFVDELIKVISAIEESHKSFGERTNERRNGVVQRAGSNGWMLRDFEVVDLLITQLEQMKASDRRRVLMSLQYALTSADASQTGDLDGFSVLKALIAAGFKLNRVNRVQLLRSIEELGGKMKYNDLCTVLMKSSADWSVDERGVVGKILKAMGIGVLERRAWLTNLKQDLLNADSQNSRRKTSRNYGEDDEAADVGVAPAAFLQCLRDAGVRLGVEEEATLLDCLDTERQAELSVSRNNGTNSSQRKMADAWAVPKIHYNSFLNFCGRHCGHWTDAAPELDTALKECLASVDDTNLGLHEFGALIMAFDELNTGSVGSRAFQICVHRSRLLSNLSETISSELTNVLSREGGGRVEYTSFLVHLKALAAQVGGSEDSEDLIFQLIKNGRDTQGTLLPIRNWLLRNSDTISCMLSPKDLNGLLREFGVMYRPEDLEALQSEIGQNRSSIIPTDATSTSRGRNVQTRFMVDSRDLMAFILKKRGPWVKVYPDLCKKIKRGLSIVGSEQLGQPSGSEDKDELSNKRAATKALAGAESAAARRLIVRLRALSGLDPADARASKFDGHADGSDKENLPTQFAPKGMVDRDIFAAITRAQGLQLSDQEILMLADACDSHPAADMIRYDCLVEAIASGKTHHAPRPSESTTHALEHTRKMLWTTATRLNRSIPVWQADVRNCLYGFDTGKTSGSSRSGFISPLDFKLVLDLLTTPVSFDILRDLPGWPRGDGLVAYEPIVDVILDPPPRMKAAEKSKKKPSNLRKKREKMGKENLESLLDGDDEENLDAELTEMDYGAMATLVRVCRKGLLPYMGIGGNLDACQDQMKKAFMKFDKTNPPTGRCSARDFCLAVSVVLDGDDVLLDESEWTEVIDQLRDKKSNKAMTVNYEKFVDKVLERDGMLEARKLANSKAIADASNSNSSDKKSRSRRNHGDDTLDMGISGSGIGGNSNKGGKTTPELKKRIKIVTTMVKKLQRNEKSAVSDLQSAINDAAKDEIESGSFDNAVDLLRSRLIDEDSNKSGSVNKQTLKAVLSNVGVTNKFWNNLNRKALLDQLEKISGGTGQVRIDDVLAIMMISV